MLVKISTPSSIPSLRSHVTLTPFLLSIQHNNFLWAFFPYSSKKWKKKMNLQLMLLYVYDMMFLPVSLKLLNFMMSFSIWKILERRMLEYWCLLLCKLISFVDYIKVLFATISSFYWTWVHSLVSFSLNEHDKALCIELDKGRI